jgi:hypothetical protein
MPRGHIHQINTEFDNSLWERLLELHEDNPPDYYNEAPEEPHSHNNITSTHRMPKMNVSPQIIDRMMSDYRAYVIEWGRPVLTEVWIDKWIERNSTPAIDDDGSFEDNEEP